MTRNQTATLEKEAAPILSGPGGTRECPDWFQDQQREALVSSGTFLYVPRGVEIELPIEIFHWLNAENDSAFPHLLLVTDELAKVTVIEHFRSVNEHASGFACGVNDLVAGPGAKVTYVCAQNWADNVIALQMNTTTVDHDASAMSLNLNLGSRYSRFESLSRLTGEGGRSDLLAVAVAKHQQEFDARTLQDHVSPHTASDLLYKNALDDRARTIFRGSRARVRYSLFRRLLARIQLEIDFYVVVIASAKPDRWRVNFSHSFRNCCNRFIHDNVFRRLNDIEFGDVTVLFDSNFHQR